MRIFGFRLRLSSFSGFTLIIVLLLILAASTICFILFDNLKSRQENLNTRLLSNSLSIEYKLVRDFDYANNMIKITGSRISQINTNRMDEIAAILSNPVITSEFSKNLFSWSLFDWISKDTLMRASSTNGIYAIPYSLPKREFITKGQQHPWTLFFDTAAEGIASRRLVVPAGMAITDKKSKLLGYISVGFDIEKLRSNLLLVRTDPHVQFILLDKNFNPILSSANKSFNDNIEKMKSVLSAIELDKISHNRKIEEPINIGPILYSNLGEIEGYPFYILSGFDASYVKTYKYAYVVPSVICILIITTIAILSILFLNYRISNFASGLSLYIKYAKEGSAKYKDTIKNFFISEFIGCFIEIRSVISKLTILKKRNIQLDKARKELRESIISIYRINYIVHNFDLKKHLEDDVVKVSVQDLIKEVFLYHRDYVLQNKIDYTFVTQKNVPKIFSVSNILLFSFMAVISQVLRAASYQAKIHVSISAHKYSDGTVSNLLIQFKDNSVLNISDEFLPNTYENDFIICEDGFLMMHIKKINEYLSSIGGSVKLHSKKFVGNNLTVEIPYQPKIKKPPRANDKGNVVNLSLSSNKA